MLIPHWRKVLLCFCLFAALTVLGTGLARVAAKSATEAPAGFNTPSFNGAQSVSNGIVEPPGDTFARDQEVYDKTIRCKLDSGPCTTQLPASVAMTIRIAEEPASSQNSGLGTRMKRAISSTRQSSSTIGKARFP